MSCIWQLTSSTWCRQRLQRETTGRRGRKDDPLYKHRRTLLTRTNYLTQWQKQPLDMLWATDDDFVALEVTWLFYQDRIAAYGHPKKCEGKKLMSRVINSRRKGLPPGLKELVQLGRTLWRRRRTCSLTSISVRPLGLSRPSTAGSSTGVGSPWGSGT